MCFAKKKHISVHPHSVSAPAEASRQTILESGFSRLHFEHKRIALLAPMQWQGLLVLFALVAVVATVAGFVLVVALMALRPLPLPLPLILSR